MCSINCLGKFFPFVFRFLTCYRVFFFFSLSCISLITLLCYVLYVNFIIVCYLAFFFFTSLRVYLCNGISGSRFFSSVALTTNPVILSAFGKQLRFHRFSLISFCSHLKVVFLYCNCYFFTLCRNLLLWFGNSKNIC